MRIQYFYIVWTALMMLGLTSCEENETPLYDVNRSALNIWLGAENYPEDSITYNYSYAMGEDSIMFYARVSGLYADHDRTFTLEVEKGSVDEAEGSFRTGVYTIPAGETLVKCAIYFDTSKLKDSNSFTEKDGFLCFRMTPNDEFMEGSEELSKLNIVLKNYLAQPDNWDKASSPYLTLGYVFGEYSREKYQFMIDVLDMMEFSINQNATKPYDEESNEISLNYANYLRDKLENALNEYNATHDEPLKDASGALITF